MSYHHTQETTVKPQFEEGITLDRFIFETTKTHREAQGLFHPAAAYF